MKVLGITRELKNYDELSECEGDTTTDVGTRQHGKKPACVSSVCVVVGLILLLSLAAAVLMPILAMSAIDGDINVLDPGPPCLDSCSIRIVESIPENLTYPAGSPLHMSTYTAWLDLVHRAEHTIDIASLYWSLRPDDVYKHPSNWQGEAVYQALLAAGGKPGVKLRVAQNQPSLSQPNTDTEALVKAGAAEVRSLNFSNWYDGGVLHTKLWVVDGRHVYVGSANMDWRSLTQVKEMGVYITDCPCLAADVSKIFAVYWYLGTPNTPLPAQWPLAWNTRYNKDNPRPVAINGSKTLTYFSSSPPEFCPSGRTSDIDSILDVIYKADKYVHIAVMDYFPITLYSKLLKFWPVIDDALRHVALEKRVEVRILASCWTHSRPDIVNFLQSLAQINNVHKASVQVKLFHVPATPDQAKIPFARVNHNKYMVTDNIAYIGTSNWSADYFIQTGGIGLIMESPEIQRQLANVFMRDWNSQYAVTLDEAHTTCHIR